MEVGDGEGDYVSLDAEAWDDFLESRFKRLSVSLDPGHGASTSASDSAAGGGKGPDNSAADDDASAAAASASATTVSGGLLAPSTRVLLFSARIPNP